MAGKSNKAKSKKGSLNPTNSSESKVSNDASVKDTAHLVESQEININGSTAPDESPKPNSEQSGANVESPTTQPKQSDLNLFPVSVKTQSGEKLELQLNPGDSVMDIRQFLLDAPETCFFTCYDLLLHAKDGMTHHLEDYNEISEVADITSGGCSLEMVGAFYDERSIRAHVTRARDLLSVSTLYSSLSTSLALRYETTRNKSSSSGDNAKPELLELDGLGFMEDVPGSLGKLILCPSKEVKSVESIVFSSFNPPPSYRRLVGDLIYLDVVTLEGNKYCITGTTKMFHVNSSTGNVLDPRPSKSGFEATTLIGLLQKMSPKFKKAFREILERKASAHPFENVQSLLPPTSWLGSYPISDHKRDAARAEEALTLSYGSELIGMQRDWNEELQSCREFPHTTPQERILRDRALYKVTSDFVDASINGAIGVISRCIPPINPTDPECFHMYVHNNIFFSFALDADLEQSAKKRTSNSSVENSHSSVNVLSTQGADNGGEAVGAGEPNTDTGSTEASAETQLTENEQATYASANNDLKGTKLFQEADVPGLYNLAMAIIDYRGHRVVAQSVLPGILQGDKSDSLLYGSVDNGKKICWNEDFHAKVVEAAEFLHLKEHTVEDASGKMFKMAAPVECKGIIGSDDRHYLLDLMRVTPRDANYSGQGARFCVLRPELITSFFQSEATENAKTQTRPEAKPVVESDALKAGTEESTQAKASEKTNSRQEDIEEKTIEVVAPSENSDPKVAFNPNVFTEFKLADSKEEIAADEGNVRKVSSYLVDGVIPKFIQDLCTLEVSPMDGQTLTEALHAHGINIRYIGKVANGTKHLPHLWDLCINEIAVRSVKHVMKEIMRDAEDHDLGPAIAHFFNCFFGNCSVLTGKSFRAQKKEQVGNQAPAKSSRGQGKGKGKSARKSTALYMNVSSDILWSDVQTFAKVKYKFELPDDSRTRVKKISVLRNLCQKVGISVAARKYDFNGPAPFETMDILNVQPVVKNSIPICSEAKKLVEMGKVRLAEGMLNESYNMFSEAFTILQQVTGPMHREVANCCRYLAMVLYHAGEMASAIVQQHKELIINERCLGLDHPDTAHSYGNMALFYHGLNQTELALRHMGRALLLLSLSSGPDHPDVAATFINVAMMYQDLGKMDTALRYLQEALKKNERLLGPEHIQTAVCYHALAIAFNCMGAFKLSHQHEKKTYDILVKQLGEEDSRTRDSQNWMKTFKMRELQLNAQKQKGKVLNAASAQKAIDILKAHPDLIQAFQSAAASGGSGTSNPSANKSLNAALMGESLPRGRGFDERAARAAAEVRKKAAARGLLIRPHGVPVQALPPLTDLLGIINSGVTSDAVDNGESESTKTETDGESSKRASESEKDEKGEREVKREPVGLGSGLTSLGAKKQKSKGKVGA